MGLVLCPVVTVAVTLELWHIASGLPDEVRHGGGAGPVRLVDALVIGCALLVILVSALAGCRSVARCLLASARLASWVAENTVRPSGRLVRIARRVAPGTDVVQVRADSPFAVTYRLWRPRVAISSRLVERTSDQELAAVLWHESHHARWRHPLGRLLTEVVSSTLWFLPPLRTVREHAAVRQELSADQAALRVEGRSVLASAMVKSLSDEKVTAAGTAMGDSTTLEARVLQLEHGPKRFAKSLRCRSLRRAVLLLCSVLALLVYGAAAVVQRGLFTPLF
ncbi:M56 family metallopeptidase [Streptomyces sp. NPDC051921]|uniref:M56 family metallopeptidase n=1 Tax=Streptomyces sp. NPDC051921 TaxID=3155806 RepID=UPI003448BA3C